jgi:hypothetical protein
MLSLDDRRCRMYELLAAPVVGLSYAPARSGPTPTTQKSPSGLSARLRGPSRSRPGLIRICESLCTTTTCSPLPRRVQSLRSHSRSPRAEFYAGSCK